MGVHPDNIPNSAAMNNGLHFDSWILMMGADLRPETPTVQRVMARITIYQKPTCTTCRQTMTILKEAGVDFEAINYYIDPIPKRKLKELLGKMKLSARDLLRTNEPIYKQLKLDERKVTEGELLGFMAKHPDLIQRPIVEKGAKAVLARPAEKIREIL